jgi:hypothetical protein
MTERKNNVRKFPKYPELPIHRLADHYLPSLNDHQAHLDAIARANKGRGFAVAKVRA